MSTKHKVVPLDVRERVRRVVVRPVQPGEMQRWKSLMQQHHYLGAAKPVGETLAHVAEIGGEWVALLWWATPALKVAPRDAWIGWTPEQRYRRLRYTTNNARFCILPGYRIENLASRVLSLATRRLSSDWQAVHGHPVVLVETFVDPAQFVGTCYKAANWILLGHTQGFGRQGQHWVEHNQPKTIWVRPLARLARKWLCAEFDPPALHPENKNALDLNQVVLTGKDGLLAALEQVPDYRHARGIRHSQKAILAMATCAVLSGARSFIAIADWAKTLTPDLLARLGARRSPHTNEYQAPSEPTFRRTLEGVDADELDRVVGAWFVQHSDGDAIAFDGKTLRGSGSRNQKPRHLLAAIVHKTAVVVAQREIPAKTNEIPEATTLLDSLDLEGKVVTADAMHAQTKLARYLVEERNANYVFTVKDNQRLLKKVLSTQLCWDFSPSDDNGGESTR